MSKLGPFGRRALGEEGSELLASTGVQQVVATAQQPLVVGGQATVVVEKHVPYLRGLLPVGTASDPWGMKDGRDAGGSLCAQIAVSSPPCAT